MAHEQALTQKEPEETKKDSSKECNTNKKQRYRLESWKGTALVQGSIAGIGQD